MKWKKGGAVSYILSCFATYTAIALVIVSVLTIYFMYLSKRSVLRQNQEEREHISANAAEYIRETEERVDYLYQDLYRSSSELEDLLSYFTLDPEEYQQSSCRYSASSALVYKGIYNFITEAFEAYQELEKVELIGYNDLRMTECYPDKIFYPGKSGKGKINAFRDGTYGEEGKLVYVREIRNPNTMAQEGCMVFTFEGKAVFEKIRRNSEYTGLFVNFQGQQPVFEENLQADTKYDSVKKETVGEYEVCTLQPKSSFPPVCIRFFYNFGGRGSGNDTGNFAYCT